MSDEEYVLITVAKQNFTWEARVLSRGMPHLATLVSLPNRLKSSTRIAVGDVCLVNMRDADAGVGTADIIELIEPKEVRKLHHKRLIPSDEEYAYLLVSDKKLGYTGGAFPYKAKLSGLGASTMPEDPDVIARAKYAAKVARRAARKAENGGVSPAYSNSTTPATTPMVGPSPTGGDGGVEPLDLPSSAGGATSASLTAHPDISATSTMGMALAAAAASGANPALVQYGSSDDDDDDEGGEEGDAEEAHEGAEGGADLDTLVNPNHAKWASRDGGVSKGYVSKRERRELEMQRRLEKRAAPPPKHSPSLIPQMEALDRVGGDAELADI